MSLHQSTGCRDVWPCLGNSFASSPFHPLVLAHGWLQCWSTPFSLIHIASLRAKLGDYVAHHSIVTLLIPVEPNTHEAYGAGLLHFAQYCDTVNVSESDRMSASDVLLGAFASSGAAKVARGSVEQRIAGICLWHAINCPLWFGG